MAIQYHLSLKMYVATADCPFNRNFSSFHACSDVLNSLFKKAQVWSFNQGETLAASLLLDLTGATVQSKYCQSNALSTIFGKPLTDKSTVRLRSCYIRFDSI